MPLVIFDGPEAAGKTTLIEALMEKWGPNSRLRSWGPRDSWLEYCQPLFEDIRDCRNDPQLLICWSRSWASRTVYNILLSQGQSVPGAATRELEILTANAGGMLVFVHAPVVDLLNRRLDRMNSGNSKPDHPIAPEKELSEFQRYMRNRKWYSISGVGSIEDNVRYIIYYLVQRNPECRMGKKEGSLSAIQSSS